MLVDKELQQFLALQKQGAETLEPWYNAAFSHNGVRIRKHDLETTTWDQRIGRPALDAPEDFHFDRWWVDTGENGERVVMIPQSGMFDSWGCEVPLGAVTGELPPYTWVDSLWIEWEDRRVKRDADRKERKLREAASAFREFPAEVRAIVVGE